MFREIEVRGTPGYLALVLLLAASGGSIWWLLLAARAASPLGIVGAILLFGITAVCYAGFYIVNPNEARVLTLFGTYVGSSRQPGLWFTNPFTMRRRVSLRVRNFETAKLKVNDSHSNPVEIAAIVVWKVVDSAEAMFEVDSYAQYVQMQSESALRALAQSYPYDAHATADIALSTHTGEISKALESALHERLAKAGVLVTEARISHLAYSPEIASAMLRRQQASAVIAARYKIVEGAVGMVENALQLLSEKSLITLDEERKAAMVSNLLVVLCSDRDAQPIVNAGTLYQ